VAGGVVTLTGCEMFEINYVGWEIGVGLNFHVTGGVLIMNLGNFFETNLCTAMISVGEAMIVVGRWE